MVIAHTHRSVLLQGLQETTEINAQSRCVAGWHSYLLLVDLIIMMLTRIASAFGTGCSLLPRFPVLCFKRLRSFSVRLSVFFPPPHTLRRLTGFPVRHCRESVSRCLCIRCRRPVEASNWLVHVHVRVQRCLNQQSPPTTLLTRLFGLWQKSA